MKKVETKIKAKTSPQKVIRAFLDDKMLKEWWGVERSLIDRRVGGAYALAWDIDEGGMKYVSTGTIRLYNPKGLLVIEKFVYLNYEKPILGPMSLTIKAERQNDLTNIYICQDGYKEGEHWTWYYEAVK